MIAIKSSRRRPPREHAGVLAVLFMLYGGFHALGVGLWLTLSLGALLHTDGRAWENDMVRDGVVGGLLALLLIVALPFAAAYGLSKQRRWAKTFAALSGTVILLLSLFMAYVGFDDGELGGAVYFVPCLCLCAYVLWFVFHKPA